MRGASAGRARSIETRAERLDALDAGARRCVTPLGGDTTGIPEAWFLGPKGENDDVLRELILSVLDDHVDYRRSFHKEDPERITARIKESHEYKNARARLKEHSTELLRCLRGSVPFFSMRYQGHMLWDQVLPATVGYFAAMLYNQNNVAAEASPVTTRMEIEVGDELCRMLGYRAHDDVVPWGHITADGTIANIESLWATRNAKFFALAVRDALRGEAALARARGLKVRLLDCSEKELAQLDAWTCLNLPIDDSVSLPYVIAKRFEIEVKITQRALRGYTLQNVGLAAVNERLRGEQPAVRLPIAIAPATRHYSWPKAATLLGLGDLSMRVVPVDLDARMELDALQRVLDDALRERTPVIAVVAVIGSTEESAVDPLRAIFKLRRDFRARGLDFAVHCDAAWGGYFNAILRSAGGVDLTETDMAHAAAQELPMSPYVIEQYQALREADSITVDPHKAGYVPYPAGALCYRNSRMRDLISLSAPVVYHSALEPTVGIYGVEGSKPGAAAAAVYLAHKVIPANRDGYGRILRECLWVSKRTYCRLVTMDLDPGQRLRITFLQRLPSERSGEDPAPQKRHIREHYVEKTDADLARYLGENPAERDFFLKLGSDQVILSYTFNFIDKSGVLNRDLAKANKLNDRIFAICSLTSDEQELRSKRLFLTSSTFTPEDYGRAFTDKYCWRLGVEPVADVGVNFLITTTMDPWTTELEPAEGAKLVTGQTPPLSDFLAEIEAALRSAGEQALVELDY
jgi:glutamate/tyrosine decarboxylase-like PLP-dependent enzyme